MSRDEQETEICATVGRMILMASILDNQMAEILIEVLTLDRTPNLLPVVATLDPSRKIEILKAHMNHMPDGLWRKELRSYVKAVEAANKARNICGHSMLIERDGQVFLASNAAAKLFKNFNLQSKTIERVPIEAIRLDAKKAEETFRHGVNVRDNFQRFAQEYRLRRGLKKTKEQ